MSQSVSCVIHNKVGDRGSGNLEANPKVLSPQQRPDVTTARTQRSAIAQRNGRSSPAFAWTYAQLLIAMVLYGSGTPVSKVVIENFPGFVATDLRMVVTVLMLAPLAWPKRAALLTLERADWIRIGLIAVVGMVGFSLALLYGIDLVSGVFGSLIICTVPAVTALGSYLFLHDRLGWRKSVAITLAVGGVALVSVSSGSSGDSSTFWQAIGIALILSAVGCEATHTLLAKVTTQRVPPLLIVVLAAAIACILCAAPAIYQASRYDFQMLRPHAWLALLWWGGCTTALGSWLWYRALHQVPASVAAGFMGVSPVTAALLSYVILDQPFRWYQPLGFVLVLGAIFMIAWEHSRDGQDSR